MLCPVSARTNGISPFVYPRGSRGTRWSEPARGHNFLDVFIADPTWPCRTSSSWSSACRHKRLRDSRAHSSGRPRGDSLFLSQSRRMVHYCPKRMSSDESSATTLASTVDHALLPASWFWQHVVVTLSVRSIEQFICLRLVSRRLHFPYLHSPLARLLIL